MFLLTLVKVFDVFLSILAKSVRHSHVENFPKARNHPASQSLPMPLRRSAAVPRICSAENITGEWSLTKLVVPALSSGLAEVQGLLVGELALQQGR